MPLRARIAPVSPAAKPRFVDTGNPVLAIECPNCGLMAPRFLQYCKNCGFALWPSGPYASAAFVAWRDADPETRGRARRYDMEIPAPPEEERPVVDYDARAHELGIHMTGASPYPIVICIGFLFLAFAAIPFPTPMRIGSGVIGAIFFLMGIFGWVVREDSRNLQAVIQSERSGGHGHAPESTTHEHEEHE